MPYLWIDPPGPDAGWLHEIDDWDAIPAVVALYDIPDDNADRKRAYEEIEGNTADRSWWGTTAINHRPNPIPEGVIMVGPDGKQEAPDA